MHIWIDLLPHLPGELIRVEQHLVNILWELDLHLLELALKQLQLFWLDTIFESESKLSHNLINLILLASFQVLDSLTHDLAQQCLVLLDRIQKFCACLWDQKNGWVQNRELGHVVVKVVLREDLHSFLLV